MRRLLIAALAAAASLALPAPQASAQDVVHPAATPQGHYAALDGLPDWGGVWTLGAWCRLRSDFRDFRPDRIARFETTGETFVETAERGLKGYLRRVGADPDAAA